MRRRRIVAIAAGSLAVLVVVFAITGILTLRSPWFHEQVRLRILSTIQEATGGRAELASYTFDWRGLRAVLRGFVLRGTEPAGKPPLFQADSITIGLKVVSLLRRDVDIRTLDIENPRIHLIVYPGGETNIPRPRIPRKGESTPVETLLNLAVGRFSLQNGLFEVEGRASIPFDARGRNLDARFAYEFAGPRYLGNLSIEPLNVEWAGQAPVPFGVRLAAVVERDRITISSGRLATGDSHIDFSGALENLVSPRASLRYDLRASGSDAARLLRLRGLAGGAIQAAGTAAWAAPGGYSATGNVHAFGLEFRRG
ncbi:MAG TPA: hypothetical protein VJ732_17975, partial [Bryobacteraceae bacterium]|nr:hypothetical protein [Bryobacteraceae bacterium]